jgi:hypothetical protein
MTVTSNQQAAISHELLHTDSQNADFRLPSSDFTLLTSDFCLLLSAARCQLSAGPEPVTRLREGFGAARAKTLRPMKYFLKQAQKESITGKISSCLLQADELICAYVFGSFTTAAAFSDIDLGILLHNKRLHTPLSIELGFERQIERLIEYPVDVRILNSAPLSFCQRVIHCGRVIVDRNPNLRADFEGKILKQYFDFSRYRRRYLAEVLNAPL